MSDLTLALACTFNHTEAIMQPRPLPVDTNHPFYPIVPGGVGYGDAIDRCFTCNETLANHEREGKDLVRLYTEPKRGMSSRI